MATLKTEWVGMAISDGATALLLYSPTRDCGF